MKRYREKKNGSMTFREVYQLLEKKAGIADYVEAFRPVLTLAEAFLAGTTGVASQVVITALASSQAALGAGKVLLDKVKALEEPTYCDRLEKMRIAYGLIYYTAFFDAMDSTMPDDLREKIQLTPSERCALPVIDARSEESGMVKPNICSGLNAVDEALKKLYETLANRLEAFVAGLAFADTPDEREQAAFRKYIKELPKTALNTFHDQFFTLCADFNEFYIYLALEQFKGIETKLDESHRAIIRLYAGLEETGEASANALAQLEAAIADLPRKFKDDDMREIAETMRDRYQEALRKPLMEGDMEGDPLTFPPVEEGFVPQAYQLLKYTEQKPLGVKDTWDGLEEHQDMTAFWARYLADMNSVNDILLILGEPGAGKSLLTKVVSARLSTQSGVAVRIPLREHEVENGVEAVETIVCERIDEDGDTRKHLERFRNFAEEYPNEAITLIFDGFDELQQATGRVYRQFLPNLKAFQQRCRENGRPVRIVVTSRETLIDKAEIPFGTTVMRLLEFDEARKSAFINVWNRYNRDALHEAGLRDFSLSTSNPELDQLSSQPLLLTMLAIYDADFENRKNALAWEEEKGERLDRTSLYDRLLRRFIRRELRKGKRKAERSAYDELNDSDKERRVDEEMRKLGVAALGMFVRGKLSITLEELEKDFIKAEITEASSRDSAKLRDAEEFLGSFFFVHDPRSKRKDDEPDAVFNDERRASFEFLHKTFYEFLIADVTLDCLVDAAYDLWDAKSGKRGEERYRKALDNPTDLNKLYFPALGGACLCAEPEIIRMTAEWKDKAIRKYFSGDDRVVGEILGDLFDAHFTFVRGGSAKELEVVRERCFLPERAYPQSCAVYLLNLLTMRLLVDAKCEFDGEDWSYLAQYVRLNLPRLKKEETQEDSEKKKSFHIDPSEETILSFMALFGVSTKTDGERQRVTCSVRKHALDLEDLDLRAARMEVFAFLQDEVSRSVYALHDRHADEESKHVRREYLIREGMDLRYEDNLARFIDRVKRLTARQASEFDTPDTLEHEVYRDFREVRYLLDKQSSNTYVILMALNDLLGWMAEHPKAIDVRFAYELQRAWQNPYFQNPMLSRWEADAATLRLSDEITKKLFSLYDKAARNAASHEYMGYRDIIDKINDIIYRRLEYNDINTALELAEIAFENGAVDHRILERLIVEYTSVHIEKIAVSARSATILLKLMSGSEQVDRARPDRILQRIWESLPQYMRGESDCLPELLRAGMRLGDIGISWVCACLDHIVNHWDELGAMSGDASRELLKIAEIVGMKEAVSASMHTVRFRSDDERLALFKHFDDFFLNDAIGAVGLLTDAIHDDTAPVDSELLGRAFGFSLKHFQQYAVRSPETAADLLMSFGKIRPYVSANQIRLFFPCVERLFDGALADGDRNLVPKLRALLDTLGPWDFPKLCDFFHCRLTYIANYSPELASDIRDRLA